MNKSPHTALVVICTSRDEPLPLSLKHTTHSHPLLGLHKCSAGVDVCHWVPYYLHGEFQFHTFASSASTSGTIASECPSAAICQTAAKWNGILVRWLNLYCHTTNICL